MPSDHPQTPQSPSRTPGRHEIPLKPVTSPANTSLPTPAHSINGSMSSLPSVVEAQVLPVQGEAEDLSSKRKRDVEDVGDRDAKKVDVGASGTKVDNLHPDVRAKYFVCKKPHIARQPNLTEDLFARFGLEEIAASVARTNPDGAKNIIRKTYKNYIKNHGLSGSFDAVKNTSRGNPDSFWEMMHMPDDHWQQTFVRGKEIEKGLSQEVKSQIGRAVACSKGEVKKEHWPGITVLGEMGKQPEAIKLAPKDAPKARTPVPTYGSARPAAKNEPLRPKRVQKKRGYSEDTYEGYAEGYVDDDPQDGYSTGNGDDDFGSRKRAKKANQFQGPVHNGYHGMVGA